MNNSFNLSINALYSSVVPLARSKSSLNCCIALLTTVRASSVSSAEPITILNDSSISFAPSITLSPAAFISSAPTLTSAKKSFTAFALSKSNIFSSPPPIDTPKDSNASPILA